MDYEKYREINIEDAVERLHMTNDFIERLIQKFLKGELLQEVEHAFKKKDVKKAKIFLHTIKGAAANVGLVGLSNLSVDMEDELIKDENFNTELLELMKQIWAELETKYL